VLLWWTLTLACQIFTSSSTTAQFLILGAMPFDYAGIYGAFSLVGAVPSRSASPLLCCVCCC
jgi:hypothetical protein